MELINSLGVSREYAKLQVKYGDRVVDATAGHGRDTLLLSGLVGETGIVYSFDIQEIAIASTRKLLESNGAPDNVRLIMDSHANMKKYVEPGISCAMFNLGYLPGSDHSVQTEAESSIQAIKAASELLLPGGIILIVIYHGGDTGFRERDEIIAFTGTLDQHKYTVEMRSFINQRGYPPIFICIQKH